MRILVPVGTRPEIIKLAPVIRGLSARAHDVVVAATGQHYDADMTEVFYRELGIRPVQTLELSGSDSERLGQLVSGACDLVSATGPDLVLVLGDTYTVPAFCLAARRVGRPVAHLEAGLRSFNPTSMEEVNRRMAAAAASLHLAPTSQAASFLQAEGVAGERVYVVGNPVCDVLREMDVGRTALDRRNGVLLTAHRATNVDDPTRLAELVTLIGNLADRLGPVTFPMHPRTRRRLEDSGSLKALDRPGVHICPPLPYRELLEVLRGSQVVVTDSGGLQEEAAWLGVPVVVLRRSTPRWEGVDAGTSVLTGLDAALATEAALRLAEPAAQLVASTAPCPYGDGHTAERVADLLDDPAVLALLALEEPNFVDGRTPAQVPA